MKYVLTCAFFAAAMLPADPALCQIDTDWEVETLQAGGDSKNRVNILVMGDGYTSSQQDKLTNDAHNFLSKFWAASPYGNYKNFFNIKLVHVISNQDGADNGSYGATRDTALGAYYNCYDIDRLLCADSAAIYAVRSTYAPEADHLMLIVNDPKYGGAGGPYSTFSVHSASGDIAVHEFAHSLGGLADEYEDSYPGYPGCTGDCPEWNVTTVPFRDSLKWNMWVMPSTPIPTPQESSYNDQVGLFEGARYVKAGVYRPRYTCTMRNLGASFCEVCREKLVLSVYESVSPLDEKLPADSTVTVSGGSKVRLEALYPLPLPDTMSFVWSVNGQSVSGSSNARIFTALGLGEGSHTVQVELEDKTPFVRRNPYQNMDAIATWTLNVEPTTDTTNAETDTELVDTDSETTSDTESADTNPRDTDSQTTTDTPPKDTDTETPPQTCTPGQKECTGLHEWAVCSEDGKKWIPQETCLPDEICESAKCIEAPPTPPTTNDNCGCQAIGRQKTTSPLKLLKLSLTPKKTSPSVSIVH